MFLWKCQDSFDREIIINLLLVAPHRVINTAMEVNRFIIIKGRGRRSNERLATDCTGWSCTRAVTDADVGVLMTLAGCCVAVSSLIAYVFLITAKEQ